MSGQFYSNRHLNYSKSKRKECLPCRRLFQTPNERPCCPSPLDFSVVFCRHDPSLVKEAGLRQVWCRTKRVLKKTYASLCLYVLGRGRHGPDSDDFKIICTYECEKNSSWHSF